MIANGYRTDAIDILTKLRGDLSEDDPELAAEIEQLDAIVADFGHKRNKYINILLGGRHSGSLNLGRRAMMGAALQTIQQWTGILAIVSEFDAPFPVSRLGILLRRSTGFMGNTAFRSRRLRRL